MDISDLYIVKIDAYSTRRQQTILQYESLCIQHRKDSKNSNLQFLKKDS